MTIGCIVALTGISKVGGNQMSQQFYGWKLIAALCVILAFTVGFPGYASSIMNTYMVAELQLDRKSLGLATASFGFCMGLFAPVSGYCVTRWGARAVMSAGALIITGGALAMATIVGTMTSVLLVLGVIMGGAAALTGQVPTQTVTNYWFRKRLALAITALSISTSIGGLVATPLLTRAIESSDGNWRMGWFVIAGGAAISFLCAILFVRDKPSDMGQVQDGMAETGSSSEDQADAKAASAVYKTAEDWTVRESVRNPAFWFMIFCVGTASSTTGMMFAHGIAHFKDLGHSPAMAAMFLSTLIFSMLGGKGLFAVLGDRIEPRFLWSAALIGSALGMALVINATTTVALYASAILLGTGPAIGTVCMFTLGANYYGKAAYAQLMGLTGMFLMLISTVATVLTGAVFDHFGSYAPVFYSAAAIFVVTGIAMPFAAAPPARSAKKR